ncbi:MAG: carbohydrate-binding protein [Bacteroidales bacterium]|nr:carbohydrate-binding protein [Bacteroidales bacterium]
MKSNILITQTIASKLSYIAFTAILFCAVNLNAQIFIEAEDYTDMNGVQTEGTTDEGGGTNVGWIDMNDWMVYTIDIPMAGDYEISFRTASMNGGGIINVVEGASTLISLDVPQTSGWQNWVTITGESPLTFSEDEYTIRLEVPAGGYNINWWKLTLTNPVDGDAPGTPVIADTTIGIHDVQLVWYACSDAGSAIAGYQILKDNEPFAYSIDTVINLSNLPPDQSMTLSVVARDLAGNASDTTDIDISTLAPDWELIWFDEFDGTEVDVTKWNFMTGPNNANNEEQYYTAGNASVSDGKLIISGKIESMGGYDYTSARLNTRLKGDWLYGRIDVNAKLPGTGGTWPAIWIMPTESVYGGWPNSGEIDIMEHVGNNLGWVFGTVHTGTYNHTLGTQQGGGMWLYDCAEAFHEYSIEWYPNRIDFYFDDIHYFTFNNDYESYMEWPYDHSFYLILNIAIGGDLGGTVDLDGIWPTTMEVDYVHVYAFEFGIDDSEPPSDPTNLSADPEATEITLSWDASVDNDYVRMYYIFQDYELIDSVGGNTTTITGLEPFTRYTFGIQAVDFAGNTSDIVFITTSTTVLLSASIPGVVQAEDYVYMEGVNTEGTSDTGGGINVGWIDAGDWMSYSVDVEAEDEYRIAYRVAAQTSVGTIHLLNENEEEIMTTDVPVTGTWQSWRTVVSDPFTLLEGEQFITLQANPGGFNLNWFEIDYEENFVGINSLTAETLAVYPNPLRGNELNIILPETIAEGRIMITAMDGKTLINRLIRIYSGKIVLTDINLSDGVYILTLITHDKVYSQILEIR